jgi:hypothetical protein
MYSFYRVFSAFSSFKEFSSFSTSVPNDEAGLTNVGGHSIRMLNLFREIED